MFNSYSISENTLKWGSETLFNSDKRKDNRENKNQKGKQQKLQKGKNL
ncbi:hypothetical protein HGP29_20400 [Flammeovirga sp. SR4]|uniref:Uncharacterized protein n=1 Tax=Flammeovirga agarivorans TaxID=2726742 RepID=A0A7X8XXT9_9BACT|nr:hypothetical protein [Flammeovirga sp. SubArs3]NLR93571.1 hypothetical protein [Flammeovirga agarivorans]